MRSVRMTAWVCGVTLLMAGVATAQQRTEEGQQANRQPGQTGGQQPGAQAGQQQGGQHQFCAASKLGQMTVRTKDGQQIGMVKDLLINTQTGQIGYLAVSAPAQTGTTPQPGAQGQVLVIPWEAFEQPQQQASTQPGQPGQPGQPQQPQQPQHLTVNLEKDRLKEAPRFTQQQLTMPQAAAQWMARVNEFYDVGETRVARPEQGQPGQGQPQQNRPNQNRQQEGGTKPNRQQ